jgi:hypothetical protein
LKKALVNFYNTKFKLLFSNKFEFQGIFVIVKSEKISRHLMVSSKFVNKIHNIKDINVEWSFSINSITYIKLAKNDDSSIKIGVNSSLNKKLISDAKLPLKNKDEFVFYFKYKNDKADFLFLLRKLVFQNTESLLKVTY